MPVVCPDERDRDRRHDRQAAVVLALAAAVTMFILFPLGLALGLLAVILGLNTDFDSGLFRG